ncbi:hypothetical protein GCM10023080_016980 [Streptomyces pseudoechinosporeus]
MLKEIELPRPVPGLSEILVAVRAAGVNPTDWWNRAQPMSANGLPLILGWDVSGVVEADRAGMQAIADLVETGALRARIEATFPLAEAAKAHALGETGRTTGKIVLTVEGTGKA